MTEQEFESRILDALNAIDTARGAATQANVFKDVLSRFARTLSKHRAIGAGIEDIPGLPGGGSKLVTWPKLRRDQRSTMLNFALQGSSLLLLGQQRREFRTPDELEAYLAVDFLRSSAFPETLALYEHTCSTPVRGFLRQGKPNEVSAADAPLRFDPDEQRKLAEAAPGTDLSVMAHEERVPLTSLFVNEQTYSCVVSGGYGMWVMFPSRAEDGRLRIAGVAMREDELA